MVDNFKQISELLTFNSEDEIYLEDNLNRYKKELFKLIDNE